MVASSSKTKKPPKVPNVEDDANRESQRRGRPRVESHDESAVERRRTQIRLAQRAYRERKESTIVHLESRVSHLEQVISEISNVLTDFKQRTATSGALSLQPELHKDFCSVMDRIGRLEQSAAPEDDSQSGAASAMVSPISRTSSISQAKTGTPPVHAIHTTHYTEPAMLDARHNMDDASLGILGYQFEYPQTTEAMIMPETNMPPPQGWSEPWAMTNAMTRDSQLNDPMSPMSSGWIAAIPVELPVMLTYSWQETSFARRLLRDSHEKFLFQLTSPAAKVDPKKNRIRYSLSLMSRNNLIRKLKKTTCKTNLEPLEDWTIPMLHVGGAGLHYARDPAEKHRSAIAPTAERNAGPFQSPSTAISVPSIGYPDKVATELGLEGVWFDNRDVEVYLQQQKGMAIDSKSSHAVVEVEDSPGCGLPTHTTSPRSGEKSDDRGVSTANTDGNESTQIDNQPNIDPEKSKNACVRLPKKKITIPIEKLIDGLNDRCFCLGRAPGYKQTDVDEILAVAILDATAGSGDV